MPDLLSFSARRVHRKITELPIFRFKQPFQSYIFHLIVRLINYFGAMVTEIIRMVAMVTEIMKWVATVTDLMRMAAMVT